LKEKKMNNSLHVLMARLRTMGSVDGDEAANMIDAAMQEGSPLVRDIERSLVKRWMGYLNGLEDDFKAEFAARVIEEIANYRAHVMTVAHNQAAQVIETERKRVHLFQANADMWRERAERAEAHERMIRDQMEHMQRRLNEANVAHDSMRVQAEHYRAQIEE
jgi:hypothetical protein